MTNELNIVLVRWTGNPRKYEIAGFQFAWFLFLHFFRAEIVSIAQLDIHYKFTLTKSLMSIAVYLVVII